MKHRTAAYFLMAVASLGAPATFAQQQSPEAACQALASARLDHARVLRASVPTEADLAPLKLAVEPPPFCRVQILDTPSSDSEIHTEVWLPLNGWNSRLRAVGNGGFAGAIYYGQMADVVRKGYATVGTDTGHTGGTPDFALGHAEKIKDFGWRAVHDMTVQAKSLVAAFYGHPQSRAYFASCSDGGREALMEAERFPEDYDGILAGAPAYNWSALMSGAAENTKQMSKTREAFLPAAKIPALGAAVNAACDAADGVKDGIINDPRTCGFNPASLTCKEGEDSDHCLLPEQVATVTGIYRGPLGGEAQVVFKGLMPGAEDGPEGWAKWISGNQPGSNMPFFGEGFFGNFIKFDPGWRARSFLFDRDYALAVRRTGGDLDATSTDLAPFFARGGKLVMYHGWNDPAIPAPMSISYYQGVTKTVGEQKAQASMRLYLVPGMQHCGFGPGATEFGQGTGPRGDARHDIYAALEQWTERSIAPGTLTAKKTEGKGQDRKTVMTRPLCAYPQVSQYDGQGDPNQAESFTCAAPK